MITKIRWKNCFCFRGEHELTLGAGVFAITAKYEDDAQRSNWGGKSSLLKLLGPMPFFGWHGADLEDDWITEGEDSAYYEVTLDSGVRIRRERTRGKSTQVLFFDGSKKVGQKGAQAQIEAHIGLSKTDFFASCFFKQKETDKLITLQPGDRYELVAGWLDLVPLQTCYERAREDLLEVSKDVTKYEGLVRESKAAIEQVLAAVGLQSVAEIDLEIASSTQRFDDLSKKAIEAGDFVTRVARLAMAHERQAAAKESILKLDAEWLDLTKARDELVVESLKSREDALSNADKALEGHATRCTQLSILAGGNFDGNCPVSAGFACPARKLINDQREKHQKELDKARETYSLAEAVRTAAKKDYTLSLQVVRQKNVLDQRIEDVERQIAHYRPLAEAVLDPLPDYNPSDEATRLNREVGQLQSRVWALSKAKRDLDSLEATLATRVTAFTDLQTRQQRLAESAAVFKLAQTKCAEEGLAEIEEGANELLADAGIDLSVKISWEKESHGLAKHCDTCGTFFPTSTKVRTCSGCQSPRGQHFVEKLQVRLSDTSGGAEDLGGLSLQLSAAAWLRSRRGSAFDTVYLDEVGSALDASNRKALGRHISNMITGRFGFKQGFVVSHSPDIDAMFQGRIEILVKKDGTRTVSVV